MDKAKEATIVRGIAASIQAMVMPTFENLNKIIGEFGYKIVKDDKSTE